MSVLRLDSSANVAIARTGLQAGDTIEGVIANNRKARDHKIAVCPNTEGAGIRKLARIIGYAQREITVDEHMHTHTHIIAFHTTDTTYGLTTDLRQTIPVPDPNRFMRFCRNDGTVGTRNSITALTSVKCSRNHGQVRKILHSVNCSTSAAWRVTAYFAPERMVAYPNVDGVVVHVHGTGCGISDSGAGIEALQRVKWDFTHQPDHGAVLMVGSGREINLTNLLLDSCRLKQGSLFQITSIQNVAGFQRTVESRIAKMRAMLPLANATRGPCPASNIRLTLQSNSSDAWSRIIANPASGPACDLLVQGGTGALAEPLEIYGAEHLLTRRAVHRATCNRLVDLIHWWDDYTARNGGRMDNNPGPGNKASDLITIPDRSPGEVATAAGASPSTEVPNCAEPIHQPRVNLLDRPDYDSASVTRQMAPGCNMVALTSGCGAAYGLKPAPTIKIATNSELAARMSDDMDVDASDILKDDIEANGRENYELFPWVASGEISNSGAHGLGDDEFFPGRSGR